MEFTLVKQIHIIVASLSLLGFLIRGYWMVNESQLLQNKLVIILPHIVDTLLLGSAIYLVILLQVNPFEVNWITAKILLLVAYIVVGTIALKRGKTKKIKVSAFIFSILIISSIFVIANIKPWMS